MSGPETPRDTAARQNLEKLSAEFRSAGATAEFHPDPGRSAPPELLVTEAGASVVILAGFATYFLRSHEGVVIEVGTFKDRAGTVRAVREHLRDQHRQAGGVDERAQVNPR